MDVANLNDYQLAWISFAKGVIVGVVLVLYSGLF
jgi:hypothetical protein